MNAAYDPSDTNGQDGHLPPAPSLVPTEIREKEEADKKEAEHAKANGTAGTREEEGGKPDAGKPSGLDNGALEIGGEAGGTITHPGPPAEVVEKFHASLALNGNSQPQFDGDHFPSVRERMNPHLQLMCGPLISYYTVKDGIWQGAAMVVSLDLVIVPFRKVP